MKQVQHPYGIGDVYVKTAQLNTYVPITTKTECRCFNMENVYGALLQINVIQTSDNTHHVYN